jgi:glycerol kinase
MQFQSDIAQIPVQVPSEEELSGIGAAYAAGIAAGIYNLETVFDGMRRRAFTPAMDGPDRDKKYSGWKEAVQRTLTR